MALLSIYPTKMETFPLASSQKKKKKTGKLDRSVLSSFTCNSHNTGISLDVFQLATG